MEGTLYFNSADTTFQKLVDVNGIVDLPEETFDPIENFPVGSIKCSDVIEFQSTMHPHTYKNFERILFNWRAKGPIRVRLRNRAFGQVLRHRMRMYIIKHGGETNG